MEILKTFENLVGPTNVISDDQKYDWGKDWTKAYAPKPLAAILPASTEEVAEVVKAAAANNLAIVPSGGRTGLSGGAVATNGEIVISTSRMRKIFEVNTIDKTLSCQAGVVTKDLQNAAWEAGLFYPVDFAATGSSHIGGNIATNAGGIKVIRYGLTRNWVAGLTVVLADGSILKLDNTCLKNNTGYDLRQLFIGSEGTLGLITECTMRLTDQPGELGLTLFGVETLENLTKLFSLAGRYKLNTTAYEMFDDKCLKKVQSHTSLKAPFSQSYPCYALLEIEKSSPQEQEKLESFVEKAFEEGLAVDGVVAQNSQQFQDFWSMREFIAESIVAAAVTHKNDVSIPLTHIATFVNELDKLISEKHPTVEVAIFGHIGDGNLHINFSKPKEMEQDKFFEYMKEADGQMFQLVQKLGGSVSAEHGVGLTKKPFLHFTRSSQEVSLMAQMKKVFDPKGIMNPGKIFE